MRLFARVLSKKIKVKKDALSVFSKDYLVEVRFMSARIEPVTNVYILFLLL